MKGSFIVKFKAFAGEPLYERMLKSELENLGLTEANSQSKEYDLLVGEGLCELPKARKLKAAILIDCGMLSAGIQEDVKVLLLNRPFRLAEFRNFVVENCCPKADEKDVAELFLDDEDKTVIYKNEIATLTGREFAVFSYLYSHSGETVSRAELLQKIWRDEEVRDTNIIDVYIKYIRSKLDERFNVKFIKAVRGAGYMFVSQS